MSNVPRLRFSDYNKQWKEKKISQLSDSIVAGGTPSTTIPEYWNGNIRWMSSGELNHKKIFNVEKTITELGLKKSSTKIIPKKSVLIGLAGQGKTRGTVAINMIDLCINQSIAAIFPNKDKFIPEFLYHNLDHRYNELRRLSTGEGGRGGLNLGIIKSIKVWLPEQQEEQEKIASFLSSIDGRIEQLTKYEELLQLYKKGVMQQLFKQEIRFKKDDGSSFENWKNKKLSKLMYEHKERNYNKKYTKNDVLSVSGKYGIVNQIELQGRSFAGASVDNYHIVNINDIVYTKSPLKANPYGIIKVNKYKAGIVSTLYAVYRPTDALFPQYIDYYFQLDDNVNRYLRPLVHKGAKNDMKINNSHVLSGRINIPSYDEQVKIVDFLSSIDSKIEKVQNQLKQTKEFKKGLLQRMFV